MTAILVINANTSQEMTGRIEEAAMKAASSGTEIIATTSTKGPRVIQGPLDQALAVPGMIEAAGLVERPFHGIVSACFGDPGLEALKAAFHVPVAGIRECSLSLASFIGNGFSVLVPVRGVEKKIRAAAMGLGVEDQLISVEFLGVSLSEIESGGADPAEFVVKAGEAALRKGAEALILGCAALSKTGEQAASRLGVPCIDPVAAAVKWMEGILYFSGKRG